jgi:GNAT superfamily N-acetyltransferase
VTLVAILTVRRDALDEFRAFERHAAAVMQVHGGRIERTVVVAPEPASSLVKEVHVVTFPDGAAFRAYRNDPRLAELAHLREASVVATQVLVGEDGPEYLPGPRSGRRIAAARPARPDRPGIRDRAPSTPGAPRRSRGARAPGSDDSSPAPAARRRRAPRSLRVRDARAGDPDAIREVTLAAYAEYAPQMPALWDHYRDNILATLAGPTPAEQIVAEQDGAVVGAVLLYPAGVPLPGAEASRVRMPWPEVRLLAVAPASRGRGVGAALMQECVRRARAAGAPALALHTTDMMQAAVRLYARLGFVREPEIDVPVAPSLTVMGYRLDLG